MLCCLCKEKEATVHIAIACDNPDNPRKVDLCEECAKTKGVNNPTGLSPADLLASLGGENPPP